MKSYTNIEQSKVLAGILPNESADHFHIIGHLHTDGPRYEVIRPRNEVSDHDNYWPCWSLAALLNIIPKHIKDIPKHIKNVNTMRIDVGEKDFSIWYDEIGYGVNTELPDITMEEPVDACVGMIIKLHELNLL